MNLSLSEKSVCFIQNNLKSTINDEFVFNNSNLENINKFMDFMSKPDINKTSFTRAEFIGTKVTIFCDTTNFTGYNWIEIVDHSELSVNNKSIKITKIEPDKIIGILTNNRSINIVVENGFIRILPIPISNLSYLTNISFKWQNFYILLTDNQIFVYENINNFVNNIPLLTEDFKHIYDKSFILFYNETDLILVGYNNNGRPYIKKLVKQNNILTIAFDNEYEYDINTKKMTYKGVMNLIDIKIDLVTYGNNLVNLPIPLSINSYFNSHSNAYIIRMIRNSSMNAFDILNNEGEFVINYGGSNYNLYIPFYIRTN